MKQITFELLRHGPPNNQLLSPLTQYLALCENHPATTLHMPFEHNQFLHRHRALSYALRGADPTGNLDEARSFQVKDTARVLGELLGQVPGLVAEMNRDHINGGDACAEREGSRATHFRMVLSASELALLPFELALSPPGFPGAGEPLLLQLQDPVCLTREVRRIAERTLTWPQQPRVLFISAFPGNSAPQGLVQRHLGILHQLLDPWADYSQPTESRLKHLITHLDNATSDDIAQACASEQYSHVHILAHGKEYRDGFDFRYGLALENRLAPGTPDVVSGERLATALRPMQSQPGRQGSRPLVVTLASCDSGNQGSVYGLGGSVAHALHQAEIPIVIASQFPLSVDASREFVLLLYEALLWGKDPRIALNTLRRRLHTLYANTHDWASVSAYASLPENFEQWLAEAETHQNIRGMEAALSFADSVTEKVDEERGTPTGASPTPTPAAAPGTKQEDLTELLDIAAQRMDDGRTRIEALFSRQPHNIARLAGKLAAIEKRCAQACFYFADKSPKRHAELTGRWQSMLHKSRQHYWLVYESDRSQSWAILQYLSLDLILRRLHSPLPDPELTLDPHEEHNQPAVLWKLVHDLSLNDLRGKDQKFRLWALGNLVELYLMAPLVDKLQIELPGSRKPSRAPAAAPAGAVGRDRAIQHARTLIDIAGPASWDVYCTRRQVLRYAIWFPEIADVGGVNDLAWELARLLPAKQPVS
ncbi:MAG: CHAT domain-containing protein [Bryobacterales bacterium]|nr:CHAT domain-containing protein [Bryobacterales bacterium]